MIRATDLPTLILSIQQAKGCTLKELAQAMGISDVQLSHWVKGKDARWSTVMPRLAKVGSVMFVLEDGE